MTNNTKIIIIVSVICISFIGIFFILPDCSRFGGFQMMNPNAGKSCECHGLEIYYQNDAATDGISASKCVGMMTNVK